MRSSRVENLTPFQSRRYHEACMAFLCSRPGHFWGTESTAPLQKTLSPAKLKSTKRICGESVEMRPTVLSYLVHISVRDVVTRGRKDLRIK